MEIHVLSQETIGRIAAGEVVERPVNVAKELIENSIDAGATAITVEIRDGGQSLLRVTDNGCGIEPSQIHRAFLRHATSKITDENDLTRLTSLGFRGEALASIAAVAQVEMITKVRESLTGIRAANDGALSLTRNASSENGLYGADDSRFYDLAGGQADSPSDGLSVQEIGAPDGTSVIVRNLFYNVPVRKKFLKQPQTEAGYVTDLIERQALSHPDISFHYRVNGKEKLHTSGNGQLKELIYRIYGRETAAALLPVSYTGEGYTVSGLIGRPEISRASRSFETFFINGRMLRSDILSKALEEGYGTDLMKHCFPFAVLHLTMPPGELDVNVHPTKMEVRFSDPQAVYAALKAAVRQSLHGKELIPAASLLSEREQRQERARREQEAQAADPLRHTEPFEARRETGRSATTPFSAAAPRHTDSQPDPHHTDSHTDPAAELSGSGQHTEGNQSAGSGLLREPSAKYRAGQEVTEHPQNADVSGISGAGTDTFFFDDRRPQQRTAADGVTSGTQPKLLSAESAQDTVITAPLQSAPAPETALTAPLRSAPDQENSPSAVTQENVPADLQAFTPVQQELPLYAQANAPQVLSRESAREYRILGQIFETYWLIAFRDQLLMIDQHAAHEKVQYERLMKRFQEKERDNERGEAPSQQLAPPCVVTLSGKEEAAYLPYEEIFRSMGYEIEEFGDRSYAIRAIPLDLYGSRPEELFRTTLEEIMEEKMDGTPHVILSKIASMSCKAAVKGNSVLKLAEAQALIDELLALDNPYHCPHGRPTMVTISKQEIEKKFKRIV